MLLGSPSPSPMVELFLTCYGTGIRKTSYSVRALQAQTKASIAPRNRDEGKTCTATNTPGLGVLSDPLLDQRIVNDFLGRKVLAHGACNRPRFLVMFLARTKSRASISTVLCIQVAYGRVLTAFQSRLHCRFEVLAANVRSAHYAFRARCGAVGPWGRPARSRWHWPATSPKWPWPPYLGSSEPSRDNSIRVECDGSEEGEVA